MFTHPPIFFCNLHCLVLFSSWMPHTFGGFQNRHKLLDGSLLSQTNYHLAPARHGGGIRLALRSSTTHSRSYESCPFRLTEPFILPSKSHDSSFLPCLCLRGRSGVSTSNQSGERRDAPPTANRRCGINFLRRPMI